MSETISQLPAATAANLTDILPATQGSSGPGTGTTRGVTLAQMIAMAPTAPQPRTVAFSFPGTISASETLNVLVGQALTLGAGSSPYSGFAGILATANSTLDVNVVQAGTAYLLATVVFTSASGTPAITASGSITASGAGDMYQVTNPGTADATLGNVAISVLGTFV
jgi:hypothetical protein